MQVEVQDGVEGVARVLLADDDDDMRALLGSLLRSRGLIVMEYRNGRELVAGIGREIVREMHNPVRLLVTDARMPGFSGVEVLRAVRRCGWRIPAILITAFDAERVRAEVHGLHALVLEKPFGLDAFARYADDAMEPRSRS